MRTRDYVLSALALVAFWSALAVYILGQAPPRLRTYVASGHGGEYQIQAHEARIDGFCTVFYKDDVRIAGVCGQHTWSEAE